MGPLLRNEREISIYTKAVSGQRLGKHVPAATDTSNNGTAKEQRCLLCGPGRSWPSPVEG
jgi:hypothetical protein